MHPLFSLQGKTALISGAGSRVSTPMEMAGMIAFLASPGASYITGQIMVIYGGDYLQESKGS